MRNLWIGAAFLAVGFCVPAGFCGVAIAADAAQAVDVHAVKRMLAEKRDAMRKLDADIGAVVDAMDRDPTLDERLRARVAAKDMVGAQQLLRDAGATNSQRLDINVQCVDLGCTSCAGSTVITFQVGNITVTSIFAHPCLQLPFPPDQKY